MNMYSDKIVKVKDLYFFAPKKYFCSHISHVLNNILKISLKISELSLNKSLNNFHIKSKKMNKVLYCKAVV